MTAAKPTTSPPRPPVEIWLDTCVVGRGVLMVRAVGRLARSACRARRRTRSRSCSKFRSVDSTDVRECLQSSKSSPDADAGHNDLLRLVPGTVPEVEQSRSSRSAARLHQGV